MRNKTRKFIRSAPLVAALAIIGALTLAGVLLMPNADTTEAQNVYDPPRNVRAEVTGTAGTSITVRWSGSIDPGAVTAYEAQWKLSSAADSAYVATNVTLVIATGADANTARSAVITSLSDGMEYDYRVRAVYGAGNYSDWLEGAPITPMAITAPTAPTSVMVTIDSINTTPNPDTANVTVSWTAPAATATNSAATGYIVATSGSGTIADAAPTTTSTTIASVASGDTVTVSATNAASTGGVAAAAVTISFTGAISVYDFSGTVTGVDSTSANAAVNINVAVNGLPADLPPGSSIVVYLEDDYFVPSAIPTSAVLFQATGTNSRGDSAASPATDDFNYGTVAAIIAPEIKTGAYVDPDKKDYAIRVYLPNFCTDGSECGLEAGQSLSLKLTTASGIKNPTEAGTHSTYVDVLGPLDGFATANAAFRTDVDTGNKFKTLAKIGLSSVSGGRGDEVTVTGSGFNDATSAGVYVLALGADDNESKWNSLGATLQKTAQGPAPATGADTRVSGTYQDNMALVDGLDFSKGAAEAAFCAAIITEGTRVGAGTVGSDDKVSVPFEVTVPTFGRGNVNFICMADGEGRMSNTDVEDFELEHSIRVAPTTATVGDTVTVFAQDYPNARGPHIMLKLAGRDIIGSVEASSPISTDGSGNVTFEVPSWAEGTLRVDAAWGAFDAAGECEDDCYDADTKLTVLPSSLALSKGEALPNELITVTGDGFGSGDIMPIKVTIDDVPLRIHEDSLKDGKIEVSSSGQFVATVVLWPADPPSGQAAYTNPTLIPGTHTIRVEDDQEYVSTIVLTIPEPTLKVTPELAGPRDIVTVSGENWPVDNVEGGNVSSVSLTVSDGGRDREYSVYADSAGRFFQEHRVDSQVTIPSDSRIEAKYGDEIVKLASYAVPDSIIEVTPSEGQPGDTISLSVEKMPVYTKVASVEIAGRDVIPVGNFSTDRTGSVTVDGVVVPGLDPGIYSILMRVKDTVAIGSLEVLSEGPIGTEVAVADGLAELGDSLAAAFHFDNVSKSWSFHDPRSEFADLNTLTNLVNGEAYWVLVSSDVDDVVLNQKSRSLTCSGGDCWNLVIW